MRGAAFHASCPSEEDRFFLMNKNEPDWGEPAESRVSRPMMSKMKITLIGLGLLVVITIMALPKTPKGPASPTPSNSWGLDQETSGHERMLTLLQEVEKRTPIENPFLGDSELREVLSVRDKPNTPLQRFNLEWEIGRQLLLTGNTDGAIKIFEQTSKLLSSVDGQLSGDHRRQFWFHTAVAHLRRGETENCVNCVTGESCLLPIQKAGVHTKKRGSLAAAEYLGRILDANPEDAEAIWLFNLAHMTLGTYPDEVPERFRISPEKFQVDVSFPRFHDIAPKLGLNTFNLCGGTIVDDFNNDGLLDLFTSTWDTAGQIRYFQNEGGGKFVERTESAGLKGLLGGLNLVQADYDNDGDIDVLVMRGAWLGVGGVHPNSLLRNDGDAGFRDVTFEAGLGDVHLPTSSASWGDYDLDGDLDLYVANEEAPCQLFNNRGDGTFHDVASSSGVTNLRYTKGVVWGDYDNDRYPDLYVSNLEGANRLYRNKGDGTFEDKAVSLGVAKPFNGFPVWFWDFDNDGTLDIFAPSYEMGVEFVADQYLGRPPRAELDRLYQGDGQGGFREVAAAKGLSSVTQPMGCNFGDLNNDGFPDFYLGTGYPEYEGLMPNLMFLNQRGESFADVTTPGGFGHIQKGHGVAFADMDDDGDQDVFIQMGGAYRGDAFGNVLFRNPGFNNHWITVHLEGVESNRSAIGSRIRCEIVENGSRRSVYKWVNSGGSFGAKPLRREIGLGTAKEIEVLEVFWPKTGRTQTFKNVAVNQAIRIVEDQSEYDKLPSMTVDFGELPQKALPNP